MPAIKAFFILQNHEPRLGLNFSRHLTEKTLAGIMFHVHNVS